MCLLIYVCHIISLYNICTLVIWDGPVNNDTRLFTNLKTGWALNGTGMTRPLQAGAVAPLIHLLSHSDRQLQAQARF